MQIAIIPKDIWVPGLGTKTANQLEVRVSSYVLGQSATAFWALQSLDTSDPERPVTTELAHGNSDLTTDQFSAWGQDDSYFANAIAANIGVTPAAS